MKEKLPIDFITNFVSKGWETVGDLKASVEAIKKEFTDTKMVADIIQDLIDAYLVALGQMELHLDKKDYLDIPEEKELKESLELKEDILVDIQVEGREDYDLENNTIFNAADKAVKIAKEDGIIGKDTEVTVGERLVDKIEMPDEYLDDDDSDDAEFKVITDEDTPSDKKDDKEKDLPDEPFEYFVDFDDADITDEEANDIANYRKGL